MKAVLVVDEMPENCAECPIRFSDEPNEWCWYLRQGLDDIKAKPSWCPLRPLPETKDVGYPNEDYDVGFGDGWNACLMEITGETE